MEGRILYRRGVPGEYDHAPFGTQCRVELIRDTEVYVQMCAEEDNPRWEFVGSFPPECDENLIEKEVEEFRHYKL